MKGAHENDSLQDLYSRRCFFTASKCAYSLLGLE